MAKFYASKIVSSLPSPLEANTLYLIRTGTGFDLYCSDSTGSIAHKLNPSGIQGPATSVAGNVAVFDNTTGNLVNDRATTVNLRSTSDGTATLGPEMVTNGYFNSGSTGWTLGNGWTMVDGKPTLDLAVASPGTLSTNITAEVYQAYRLASSVTMTNPEFGFIEISLGSNRKTFTSSQSQFFLLTGPATAGTIAIVFTPTIDAGSTGTIKVDYLSCKQITAVPAAARIDDGSHRTDFRQYRGSINIGNGGAYRTGSDVLNVSIGMDAAGLGISNSNSVFVGNSAGSQASSVWECTLVGYAAGDANLGNFNNTLVGAFCGQSFWSGNYNTAIGHSALGSSRSGSNNSALGVESGYKTGTSLYIKIPTNCTYIGASTKASTVIPINETVLGANAIGAGNNTVQLGDPNVTLVQTSGQLKAVLSYTNTSSDAPNLTIDSFGNIKRSTASLSGLPDQTGQEGKFLFTDGTNPSWQNAGEGVPVGGTTNQVLAKASNTDFDTAWVNPSDGSSLPDVAGNSGKFLSNDGTDLLWGFPEGTLPSPAGNSGKYLTTDGTNVFWDTVPGGSIAPGTIQYFAADPGAGWLKCDGATYLRASYPDLAAALPIDLLNCPPSFGGAEYTSMGGNIADIAPIPGTNYLLLHCSGYSGKQLELLEYDPATQSVSKVGNAASYSGANVGMMSIAQDGGTTYVAGATYQSAASLDLFKIVGTTITKLSAPSTLPTSAETEAVAFFNGGANLAIGLSAGEPTGDVRIWTYSRSGDTFTKDAEIGGLPVSPVSFRWMEVSPSGKTLWATLDRDTSKNGHLFDVSGSTLTKLTESGADPINGEFNVAFAPRTDIDVWFSGSYTLFAQYRLGATNAVLGTNGRTSNDGGQAAHVGAGITIAFSSGGDLLVTSRTDAPWSSVFLVGSDFVLTPMFSMPDVSMSTTVSGRNAVFTPDSRCIVTRSATSTTLQLIRSDTTKLIVPRLTNGWIKT